MNWLSREVLVNKVTINLIEYMDTNSRIQELANNSEIENSQNESHAKISKFTVFTTILMIRKCDVFLKQQIITIRMYVNIILQK